LSACKRGRTSGLKAQERKDCCAGCFNACATLHSSGLLTSTTRISSSSPPATRVLPSGDRARARTGREKRVGMASSWVLGYANSRTAPSSQPEAKQVPAWEAARAVRPASWWPQPAVLTSDRVAPVCRCRVQSMPPLRKDVAPSAAVTRARQPSPAMWATSQSLGASSTGSAIVLLGETAPTGDVAPRRAPRRALRELTAAAMDGTSRLRADWELSDPALVAYLRDRAAALTSPSKKADAPAVGQQTERHPHAGEARAALVSLRNKLQVSQGPFGGNQVAPGEPPSACHACCTRWPVALSTSGRLPARRPGCGGGVDKGLAPNPTFGGSPLCALPAV
jgi:hypothetical protein